MTEEAKKKHITFLNRLVAGLKKELGDKSAELVAKATPSVTKEDLAESLRMAVESAYTSGDMHLIFNEKPKITFHELKDGIVAKPANEAALRIIQILNQSYFLEFAKMDDKQGAKH